MTLTPFIFPQDDLDEQLLSALVALVIFTGRERERQHGNSIYGSITFDFICSRVRGELIKEGNGQGLHVRALLTNGGAA